MLQRYLLSRPLLAALDFEKSPRLVWLGKRRRNLSASISRVQSIKTPMDHLVS